MSEEEKLIKLKRDTENSSLVDLEVQAKERFKSLDLLVNCNWDDSEWSYLKKSKSLKFQRIGGGKLPVELETIGKIFVVNILWSQRLRAEPFALSYISSMIKPLKIWAEMEVEKLADINQDFYDATIIYLRDRYAEPASVGVCVNRVIDYINNNNLLKVHIDTQNIRKALGSTDEQGRVLAKKEKIPLPELVKAIIHLKWAVDDSFDGSAKAINDKLCILTQVFQYGLGLRLGEVLRLPKDPLREIDGEIFCLVWTEKGSEPMARYVPSIWRKPLADALQEIHKLTQPYRDIAVQIEQQGAWNFLDERVKSLNKEKEVLLAKKIAELDFLLGSKVLSATKLWQLKTPINASQRYELKELGDILPIASDSKSINALVKYYKGMGVDLISESLGTRKHKHYVTGEAINKAVDRVLTMRASYVTLREFLAIMYPNHHRAMKDSKDKLIKDNVETLKGRPMYMTFADEAYHQSGICILVISYENALKILKNYVLGGYDCQKFLPLKDLEKILPELISQKSASRDYLKEICGRTKYSFYTKQSGNLEFIKTFGYLANVDKLKSYFLSEYERQNLDIEKELLNASFNEYVADGVEISSKSFKIKQQPSEHLFIRAGRRGGIYFDHLPQVLGYYAVIYFFGGNDRCESAFSRYDVIVDDYVAKSWQSHKGRHWQTTSLFRAGLAEMVVNKWMGRTTGQGDNYDHNTGRERAKVVGDAMLEDTERFLGDTPNKVRSWKQKLIPTVSMEDHLNDTLQSIQYGPLGYCTRSLYLKPCELNLKCLTGNDGKGCKHYIYDLNDPSHREKIAAERDKSSQELSRLFEAYERGIDAAKMHINHHMIILRNTTSILDNAEIILNDEQLEGLQDYMPFKKEGSYPDDCPFQCVGDE